MEQLVSLRDYFQVQFDALRSDLSALFDTSKETLAQTKLTNGRVNELERLQAEHATRVKNLEREVFRSGRRPVGLVTKRDVALVLGTLAAAAAIVKWLPALMAAGTVAP